MKEEFLEIYSIMLSLNPFQYLRWLLGFPSSTVNVLSKSRTPCCHKYSKLPDVIFSSIPKSDLISL